MQRSSEAFKKKKKKNREAAKKGKKDAWESDGDDDRVKSLPAILTDECT